MTFAASATLSATTNNPWSCHRFDETFKLNRPGGSGAGGFIYFLRKPYDLHRHPPPPPPPLPPSKFPVTRARICTTYTSVWNTSDNTSPTTYMETPYSSPSSSAPLPSAPHPFLPHTDASKDSGLGSPVKSAVRSIDRATPKIVECRLAPRPNPAGKVDYANACRKRRTMQRERIGRVGEGQVVTGAEIERKNKRTKGKGKKEIVSDGGFRNSMYTEQDYVLNGRMNSIIWFLNLKIYKYFERFSSKSRVESKVHEQFNRVKSNFKVLLNVLFICWIFHPNSWFILLIS